MDIVPLRKFQQKPNQTMHCALSGLPDKFLSIAKKPTLLKSSLILEVNVMQTR